MELYDYNLTPFQQRWADAKAQEASFDQWVLTQGMTREGREQGVIVLPYYTTDGRLHAARIGGKARVLQEVVSSERLTDLCK